MAWSEGRGGDGASLGQRQSDLMAAVARIDALLDQLASDESFQQDLQAATTARALEHWTGANRLPADEAEELFDEDDYAFRTHVRPCLSKLARLQNECRQARTPLPLDRVLARKRTLFDRAPPAAATPATSAAAAAAASAAAADGGSSAESGIDDDGHEDAFVSKAAAWGSRGGGAMTATAPTLAALPWLALLVAVAAVAWGYYHGLSGNDNRGDE